MKGRSFFQFLVITVLVFSTVIACYQTANNNNPTPTTQPVNIGTILGLSGEGAVYGKKMQKGFEFAIDENGKDKVKLLIENSEFDPAKAVSTYQKLIGVQGVKVLVGITGSKNALQVCSLAKADNVVIIDALSTAPKISDVCGDNYFRVIASDALAGKYNVDWAIESGMKKPAIVYIEDDWGTSYLQSTLNYLKENGFTNVPTHGVQEGDRDFRTQIEKLKTESPDTIFLLVYAKGAAGFMQQFRQVGLDATIYGSDNLSSSEFVAAGKDVVEGVRVALPATTEGQKFNDFSQAYKTKFGEEPDAIIIKSYDAMEIALEGIEKFGNDPTKIKEYLSSDTFQYQGVSGDIKFDKNGDLVSQKYTPLFYQNGVTVPFK